jgi:hypothetical protein
VNFVFNGDFENGLDHWLPVIGTTGNPEIQKLDGTMKTVHLHSNCTETFGGIYQEMELTTGKLYQLSFEA